MADMFSGRASPEWIVDQSTREKLEALWAGMKPLPASRLSAPKLGYRGVYLKGPRNREWHAYEGVVTFTEHNIVEAREDSERKFEKVLVSSAPEGLLPTSFLGDLA